MPSHHLSPHGRSIPGGLCAAWLVLLAAIALGKGQTTVLLDQSSNPPGAVPTTSTPKTSATTVTTVTAPAEYNGYRFAYWSVAGTRREDVTGRAANPASFVIYENTACVAHYLPATQDTDSDGVPDWYEIQFYGTLTNSGVSDTDGDGLTLLSESQRDLHPRLPDSLQDGNLSRRRSEAFWLVQCTNCFLVTQASVPPGIVSSTSIVTNGTIIALPSVASLVVGGYRFGGWYVNGVRVADATGHSRDGLTCTITNETTILAYFYPETADSDSDGVPDWYEWRYYGTLANDATSDTDADGVLLKQEYDLASHPSLPDSLQDGSVSRRRSEAFPFVNAGYASWEVASLPPGVVTPIQTYVPVGTVLQTPTAPDNYNGYTFGQWQFNGVRQTDALGYSLNPVSVAVGSNTLAVAWYYPTTADTDSDGVPDWYEWRHYGNLDRSGLSDTDADGLSLLEEYQRGAHPSIADGLQDGGLSRRRSEGFYVNLQPFERPSLMLVDGAVSNLFLRYGGVPGSGGTDFGSEVAPALGDYDGDGDLDLFITSSPGGLRVFQNIGTRFNMNLTERTANFTSLAALCSAYAIPVLALGDWNGNGTADLVLGGSGGTVQILSSPGHFNAPQAFTVNYLLASGSTMAVPALGDLNNDGRRDLLLLLADGTVDVYTNTGNATVPFATPATLTNVLGTPIPNGISLAVADINYDGRPDVMASDVDGRIWEFFGNAGGGFTLMSKVWGGAGFGLATRLTLTTADLDGDGDIDALAGTVDGGVLELRDPRYAVPTNLRAYGGLTSVRLEWDPNQQSRIAGYNVYRSAPDTNAFGRLNTPRVVVPRYDDTLPVATVTNHYRVTAISSVIYPGNSVPQYLESRPSEIASARAGGVTLTMPDYYGRPGSNTLLQIATPLASGITGTNLEIRLSYNPALLTPVAQINPSLTSVQKTALTEGLSITNNGRTASGELVITGLGGGPVTGLGTLFTVHFRVAPSAPLGTRATNAITAVTLRDAAGNLVPVNSSDVAVLTVAANYFPGDVNGDGQVTQADFVLAMKLAVGQRTATEQELAAGDLNGNGVVDKDDAQIILGWVHGRP